MRFGLIANLRRVGAHNAIDTLVKWIEQTGHNLCICDDLKSVGKWPGEHVPRSKLASQVDVIVSMGGDGTLLATARAVGSAGTPILGINLGSLGFLTQQTPVQLEASLQAVADNQYQIEERMLLKATTLGRYKLEEPFALNDIVLGRSLHHRILDINLKVNGEDVVTYIADGLIIATPTGSTAYSLAVGGPLIHPKIDAIIAAPIAAFSLATRPMIFSGDDQLELCLTSRNQEAYLTLDGQVGIAIHPAETITITKADFRIRLVTFTGSSYYALLKNKLHWGVPPNYHS